jgi:hypothetical protein
MTITTSELTKNLLEDLHNGVVQVTFTKKDGTERVMNCTLSWDHIPPIVIASDPVNKLGNKKEGIITVWDLDKNDWRCFRQDSVTAIVLKPGVILG